MDETDKDGRTFPVNGVVFTGREHELIKNCITYSSNGPAGLPGHNLMIIISKMANAYPIVSDIEDAMWDWE